MQISRSGTSLARPKFLMPWIRLLMMTVNTHKLGKKLELHDFIIPHVFAFAIVMRQKFH